MLRHYLPGLLLAAACTEAPSTTIPGAQPLECDVATETRTYRIDSLVVPFDAATADQLGADLDEDGAIDNHAGNLLFAVAQAYPDVADSTPARLQGRLTSDVVWLVEVETCRSAVRVALARGEIDDAGAIRVAGRTDYAAAGSLRDGRLVATLGTGLVPLGLLADLADLGSAPAWHDTFPVELDLRQDGPTLTGTLAGGLAPGYIEPVAAGFVPYLQMRVDQGTTEWGLAVDANGDGAIALAELVESSLFLALVRPDLDVLGDGPPAIPAPDATDESFSFGFGIRASEVDSP